MVYKVCKGGVRSGNTLRGLNTRNAQRYSRHACLIGQTSSMSSRDVTKMVIKSTDDPMVTKTVQSTDVILSLNKKQRWLLPSTLRHMIQVGYFPSSSKVSLLERHKLKRKANCVSFVSNKGKTTLVHPKQKRYFSFNFNTTDDEPSGREKRRLKALALLGQKSNPNPLRYQAKTSPPVLAEPSQFDEDCSQDTGEGRLAEYRMEVFYPCPKTCSLTFNPKYTDVAIEDNEKGEHEVRAVKSQGKSKARRRHRRKERDEEIMEMWRHSRDDVEDFSDDEPLTYSCKENCKSRLHKTTIWSHIKEKSRIGK